MRGERLKEPWSIQSEKLHVDITCQTTKALSIATCQISGVQTLIFIYKRFNDIVELIIV